MNCTCLTQQNSVPKPQTCGLYLLPASLQTNLSSDSFLTVNRSRSHLPKLTLVILYIHHHIISTPDGSNNSEFGMTAAMSTRIQTYPSASSLHIQPLILKSTHLLSVINSLILALSSSLSAALIPADLFALSDITDSFDSSFDMSAGVHYVCLLSHQHHMFAFDWKPK